MKIVPRVRARKSGQTVMIVAMLLAFGVLIGLVALAFDGGSALLQRRTMQNGAEAGTLAGTNKMMEPGRIAVSCVPLPCHPTFNLRNDEVWAAVTSLAQANRGGAIQGPDLAYSIGLEYHYMSGSPVLSGTYGTAPPASNQNPVPDWVDGMRVATVITNPTTFAKAFFPKGNPQGIETLTVRAKAASRIYPSCAPETPGGPTLPFTRLRPALEEELYLNGNSTTTPYNLWTSHGDLGGQWKNKISLNELSFHPIITATPPFTQQLLTAFDTRNGSLPLGAGLTNCCTGNWSTNPCSVAINCADMRGHTGSDDTQDFANWIGWQWRGTISTTTDYGQSSMTYYPANQSTDWGRNNLSSSRVGDWAETNYNGDNGNNIAGPINDVIDDIGTIGPLSGPPLNYGMAITRTVFVWGVAAATPGGAYSSDRSSQKFIQCPGPGTCSTTAYVWQDVNISGPNGPTTNRTYDVDGESSNVYENLRVRFTRSYDAVLYEGLQTSSNEAHAIIVSRPLPGPGGTGTCTTNWEPGGGVYSGQVPP